MTQDLGEEGGQREYLRSEVPIKMNIYFVGCAVSSAQLPCPKLG